MSFSAPGTLLFHRKYQNHEFPTFDTLLQRFLDDTKLEANITTVPISACFAVAGPVAKNKVQFTNRESWVIDGDKISNAFGIKRVRLVNDFVANGYGLLCLDEKSECITLQVIYLSFILD